MVRASFLLSFIALTISVVWAEDATRLIEVPKGTTDLTKTCQHWSKTCNTAADQANVRTHSEVCHGQVYTCTNGHAAARVDCLGTNANGKEVDLTEEAAQDGDYTLC